MLILQFCLASYDFRHHSEGHELTKTLVDEPESIYIIFIYKDDGDDDKITSHIDKLRSAVRQKLLGQDVYYTEVDLTTDESAAKYKEFTDMIGVDKELIDYAPIIALAYNRGGFWIHGDGVPRETAETIQGFVMVQQNAAKGSSSSPVSLGGDSTDSTASSETSIAVGGHY